jgi:hypothetical protein
MQYFANMPLVQYTDLDNPSNTSIVLLTNIFTRSSFLREIMDNTSIWYEYQMKEFETPEIIADKLYGDVNRHWIILMFNQILDPFYSFPISDAQLDDYIVNKYDQSIEDSANTLHHYEQTKTVVTYLNGLPQDTFEESYTIASRQLNMTTGLLETTPYLPSVNGPSLAAGTDTQDFGNGFTVIISYSNKAISNYEYEHAENEKKRSIKLLDKAYVTVVEAEFRRLMRDGN